MDGSWVLDWTAAEAAGPGAVGGKGWNLARLARYGFQVPPGGVVTAAAYARFMEEPDLRRLREGLEAVTAEDAAAPGNVQRLEAMQEAIRRTPLPHGIAEAVRGFLAQHHLDNVPLAVRSSATAEDGATASFAGIHASRLGQIGLEAVIDGIRECYASLWSPRAVAYRRRLGLSDGDVLCAVVLCRMVGAGGDPAREPEAAGVAFSCDPRSGRRDVATIGAVRGLGESLVSGRANPEEIVVEMGWQPAVVERRSGHATGAASGSSEAAGTELGAVVAASAATGGHAAASGSGGAPVLDDRLAVQLAHLVERVHWALGDGQDPQDVEWAYDGTSFWLLQARPATGLPRYTFPGADQLPLVWSNANLKDALPGILSPYGWSISVAVLRRNLFASQMAAGYPVPPGLEATRRFAGRAYMDFTSLFWAFYDGFGISAAEFNRTMGGHQPELPVDEPDPMKSPHAGRRNRTRMRLVRAILRLEKRLPKAIEVQLATARRYRGTDLTGETMQQLRQRLHQLIGQSYEFGPQAMLANTAAGVWHNTLEIMLSRVAPAEAAALASDLVSGSGQVVSAEHGYRLLDLAAAALADPGARAYLGTGSPDPHGWRQLPAGSPFRAELERFLHDFGHRGVYEVDIANPRWIEDPTYILEQVRFFLQAGVPQDFREAGTRRREQALRAVARRSRLLTPFIRWAARRASYAAALREGAKSALVALLEPCRRIILEAGRRMQSTGILDNVDDVFYLTWIDLDAYMRGWWDGTGARALVEDRKAQREAWLPEHPPDVIFENGAIRPAPREAAGGHAGQVLRGTGVAAGTATGRVRILPHPGEGGRLAAGEILVAPSTDPGWTPLFMRAAAIAMEVGGYHSHGAIVAREFGIPAVANIPGLLETLQDGETVTVDGSTGTVARH